MRWVVREGANAGRSTGTAQLPGPTCTKQRGWFATISRAEQCPKRCALTKGARAAPPTRHAPSFERSVVHVTRAS